MNSYFGINSTFFVQFTNNLIKQQYYYGTVILVPIGIQYIYRYIFNLNIINY
jgi:hypothetical protein